MYEDTVRHTNSAPAAVSPTPTGVSARGLGKRYGDLWALRDVDLDVPAGSVLGLLGHNGAGKTTAVRILTTLARPTTGTASVAGFDVGRAPGDVRARIGLAGQYATVDGLLTARANLEMVGRLYRLPRAEARRRGDELLERLGLTDAADRLVKTFSGGMRRRLDLAASLVARPPVLFLDEPTTGLDPQSRNDLWLLLRELVGEGATLVLTTQYLEEADRLADDVVVLDHGRVAAHGSPAELKARVGGERIEVRVVDAEELLPAELALSGFADAPPSADGLVLTVPVRPETSLMDIVRALDAAGVEARDVHRREATLDDVFLSLTQRQEVPA
jgi:ABC-2 type transport system ATP-binding protein